MNTAEKLARYVLPTYSRFSVSPIRGEGTMLWDADGKRYLDFCSGLATCTLGHGDNALSRAIARQAGDLIHCCNLYQIDKQAELAECLVEECLGLQGRVFFSNSGAESNDGLVKLARRFGKERVGDGDESCHKIITFHQSFHGRTLGGIAATAQSKVKEGFDPLLPGFQHCPLNDLGSLASTIAPDTCAIMLEPIQGEGGIHLATPEFLRGVQDLCQQKDLLLLLDEVQCGLGRTGDMAGWRSIEPSLTPDAVSWAKGLGGGFPVGAFWVSDRLTSRDKPLFQLLGAGSHGSTFGGSPLACTAALAVLREVIDKNLPQRAIQHGQTIQTSVESWQHRAVTEIRGKGLLLGIGLRAAAFDAPENTPASIYLSTELAKAGLLAPPAGPDTVRLMPPLTVSEEEIQEALGIFKYTLDSICN
ncbi:MAG: aspartate aminotransferase family protein [Roseibacillus sp.]|nr:aspartate aminotransferase family protein [Roseibacillus sp.]|tara:strand:+ start:999 stop:2252 length:1254 start_codon:yes stop_codon:yes gene_type:complete